MSTLLVLDDTPPRSLQLEELTPGQRVEQRVVFDAEMLRHFDAVARDRAPVHADGTFARALGFDRPIIQGLALSTRFSRLIGMYLPGERAVLEKIELTYRRPVFAGDELVYAATVERVIRAVRTARLQLEVTGPSGEHVVGRCQCLIR